MERDLKREDAQISKVAGPAAPRNGPPEDLLYL